MLRLLRKGILLYILLLVAVGDWLMQQRLTSWEDPVRVGIYPINGDRSEVSQRYIGRLSQDDFDRMAEYLRQQATRFGVNHDEPVRFVLMPEVEAQPPLPPRSGNVLEVIWWSLNLRWWVWTLDVPETTSVDIKMFVRYFDPGVHRVLEHSLGLKSGRVGIVNAFSSRHYKGSNQVIMSHEFLHTLGATDKYDPATDLPRYPEGYADPELTPRYPQRFAELMGGRIPVSPLKAEIPRRLSDTIVGLATAREIGWTP